MENVITTDEAQDVVGSLRHCLTCLELSDADPMAWKWAFLSLHAALQGACVCHLTTTASPVGALTDNSTSEWLKYFEEVRTYPKAKRPKTKLQPMPKLIKKIRKNGSGESGYCDRKIKVSDTELQWIQRLHDEIRSQFVHFAPMGWSIDTSGFPEFAKLCARIISDIQKAGWGLRHLSADEQQELRSLLQKLSNLTQTPPQPRPA